MERIWQDYRGSGVFQILALDCWNGTTTSVQSFIDITHVTFPVLRDAGFLQQGPGTYNILYDNYVVVDAGGVVRWLHRSTAGMTFRPTDEIIAAVTAAS